MKLSGEPTPEAARFDMGRLAEFVWTTRHARVKRAARSLTSGGADNRLAR